jgi:immunity protein, SdpI family
MKHKIHVTDIMAPIVLLVPYLYLLKVYATLPAVVPTHFNAGGLPNGYGNKSSLWLVVSILTGTSMLVYLILRFIPSIDPKKQAKYSATTFNKIAIALVLLFCLINCFMIHAAKTGTFGMGGFLPVVLGIFFAFLGNLLHSIKPNYFAGIRTPWTLENPETWRKTHQLGGKLWFIGGIMIAVEGFLLPPKPAFFVMFAIIAIMTIWPVIYSYTCFKSIEKRSQANS